MAESDTDMSDLQSRFAPNKPLEQDVLSELQSIMRLHDLSAEDLFYKWESYCIKMDTDTQDVTLGGVRNLKQSIQDELEKGHRQAPVKNERKLVPQATPRSGGPRAPGSGGDVFGMLDGLVPSTPATGGSKLSRTGGSATAKRKTETPKAGVASSPASRMGDQLKSMNGMP